MPTDVDNIRVSLPLRDVLVLYDLIKDYPSLLARLHVLEAEIDGLRANQSRMMIMLGDIKRGA